MNQKVLKKASKFIMAGLIGVTALFSATPSEASSLAAFQGANELKQSYNVVNSVGYSNNLIGQLNTMKLTNLDYSNVIWMEATGYSRFDPGCGDYTATGEFVHYGLAAVDPSVIPLGTNMYVEGYGHALAADTGGAIKGNRIDLAFDSHQEALNWGRRGVNVYL